MELTQQTQYKKLLGIRLSAIWETLLFLFIASLGSFLFGDGDRFINYQFHPFWIIVLLTSCIYGSPEGLFAALASTIVLYFHNIPSMQADQTLFAYQLQIGLLPMLWCLCAFILGEIRSSLDWKIKSLSEETLHAESKAEKIAAEFASLKEQNQQLSLSLSSKEDTVSSAFEVFKALESIDPVQVITGLDSIVKLALHPKKFSVYAMGPAGLEAVTSEGWEDEDTYVRRFTPETPLYHAMIEERRLISVINRTDQKILGVEGVLASPLIDPATNSVFGMIKVESIEFQYLNLIRIESFKTVCELIGKAYANSKEHKKLMERSLVGSKGLYSYASYEPLTNYLKSLVGQYSGRVAEFTLHCRLKEMHQEDISKLKMKLPPSTALFYGAKSNELLLIKPMLSKETLEEVQHQIVKVINESGILGKESIKISGAIDG